MTSDATDIPATPVVTVFGAGGPEAGDPAYEYARRTGRVLGELGYDIANGGYGGTMEASARGARQAGRDVIGVTCRVWSPEPNEYTTRSAVTDTLEDRLKLLIQLGSAGYVVLPGATGTLVELAFVWESMCKKMMPARPIVCMGGFWAPLLDMMTDQLPRSRSFVTLVDEPAELAEHFPPADQAGDA
ncbi:MAG: LOG family protein [Planctomycetota bacterium]